MTCSTRLRVRDLSWMLARCASFNARPRVPFSFVRSSALGAISRITSPLARIRRIAPYLRLVAMQQLAYHLTVMPIGRRRYHRMDQLRLTVYTKMGFHPKIPWIALARVVHFRIPALLAVPGRTRRFNDRCIDDRALLDLTSLIAQVAIDLIISLAPPVPGSPASDRTCVSWSRPPLARDPGRC